MDGTAAVRSNLGRHEKWSNENLMEYSKALGSINPSAGQASQELLCRKSPMGKELAGSISAPWKARQSLYWGQNLHECSSRARYESCPSAKHH